MFVSNLFIKKHRNTSLLFPQLFSKRFLLSCENQTKLRSPPKFKWECENQMILQCKVEKTEWLRMLSHLLGCFLASRSKWKAFSSLNQRGQQQDRHSTFWSTIHHQGSFLLKAASDWKLQSVDSQKGFLTQTSFRAQSHWTKKTKTCLFEEADEDWRLRRAILWNIKKNFIASLLSKARSSISSFVIFRLRYTTKHF